MPETVDVAIIGTGTAGLAAAGMLSGRGLDVRLLDENPRAGGQLLRGPALAGTTIETPVIDGARRHGLRLLARLVRIGVAFHQGVQVLGIFPDNRLLVQRADGRVIEMAARCIVCASGARERFIPFPGWHLPGVVSTGAVQILLKSAGMLPTGDILVGGAGPLPLLLAHQLASHGGRVAAVVDSSSVAAKLRLLRRLPWQAGRLARGAWLTVSLALAGIPLRSRHWIVGAFGKKCLESVAVARLDREGRVVAGSRQVYATRCLAVGFGFVPNIELLLQAGCETDYRADGGGWVVRTDERMQTSQANLFAAGEVTGIAGGDKALVEGRMCGLSVLETLGVHVPSAGSLRKRLLRRRRREMAFGAALNRMCRPPSTWVNAVDDETVICRCEDVRMGEVRRSIAEGAIAATDLKKATRCGMGDCQGRICGPIIADILDALAGGAGGRREPPSMRAPVKMVPLGALARTQLR
jgi:NADPH-dependent 2,4-dienoyl-CoA reductase/sulfur reductase-like enzyme